MMMQNILGTEVNEFVTNRQNSKIQFLQAENAQLQEDIKDLEQALKLNKEALKLAYEQQRKQYSTNNSNSTTLGQSNTVDQEGTNKLFDKLYQENKQLFQSLQRVTRERNQAQSKVLIQEQVNEEAVSFQKDVIQELEEKILELRRIIHDKEYAIQELEKMKPQQERDVAIKIREIITPNEQSIKLHNEIENHKLLIKKLSFDNQKLKERNEKLKQFNRVIKRDVIKIKVALKNPINFNKMKEFIHNDKLEHGDEDLLINKEFIKEFYEEKEEWNEQHNQNMYNKNFYQNPNIKSKAQLIDDIQKLQMTVRNFKILFHRELQNNQILLKQIDQLQQFNAQACETNQTLIESQKPYSDKVDKMKQEIDYYKQYYQKYMDLIRNRRKNNSSASLDKPLTQPPQQQYTRHGHSPSMPMNCLPIISSPRNIITEALEHEEITARPGEKSDRRDISSQSNNYLQPLVSPSYAQQQQQRVLLFMQTQKNPSAQDQNSNNNNNISNNMQQQPDYDLGYAYPSTARPFTYNNNNISNSNNLVSCNNINSNNNNILQDLYDSESKNDLDDDNNDQMNLKQCKNYLLNLAKDFYENSNIKQNQKQIGITKYIKDKLQGGQMYKVGAHNLTRAKRSLSDPLDYIFQEDPNTKKLKEQEEKKMEEERRRNNDPNRLFSVDMSMINGINNQKFFKSNIGKKSQIVIDANASFISEGDVNF
ncbi:hypothetical protein ABPG74_016677 [Tetrahymena malaccensis]